MATVRDLDARVDDLEKSFLDLKVHMETMVMLGKWATGFAAATLVTVLIQSFSVAYSAGRLESDVSHQSTEINKLNDKVDRLEPKIKTQNRNSNEKFDKLSKQNDRLLAELRKPKAP